MKIIQIKKITKRIAVSGFVFMAIFFTVFLSSCIPEIGKDAIIPASETVANNEKIAETVTESAMPVETEPESEDIHKDIGDFAIKAGDEYISLLDWDNEVDIYNLLGKSLSETTEVLGEGADTFAGSFVKNMKFDGLEIKLFSPSDNGMTFWVMDMLITKEKYETSRGVSVGDSLDILEDKYPSISRAEDGRTDENNSAYLVIQAESYNYLLFEVSEGIISQIHIYHEIP